MDFGKIPHDLQGELKQESFISEDGTVLLMHVSGVYKRGSAGNTAGLHLFSGLASGYFMFEPICIILDLSELDYTWGNTLLRSLNFFQEIGRDKDEMQKAVIVVVSPENESAITELLAMTRNGNRFLCHSKEEAEKLAKKEVETYLN